MKPENILERYLYKIVYGYGTVPDPRNREQYYLKNIADNTTPTEQPRTRVEKFLYYIGGGSGATIPTYPQNRKEVYLSKIAHGTSTSLSPQTKEEYLLYRWANNGRGLEKTATGTDEVHPEYAYPFDALSVKFYGKSEKVFSPTINQWDEEWELGRIDTTTGQTVSDTTRFRTKNYNTVNPSSSYYFKNTTDNVYLVIFYYDENKNFISFEFAHNETKTTPSNCYYIRFYQDGTTYNHDISINYPATETTYHPANFEIIHVNNENWTMNDATDFNLSGYQLKGIGTAKDHYDAVSGNIHREIWGFDIGAMDVYRFSTNIFYVFVEDMNRISGNILCSTYNTTNKDIGNMNNMDLSFTPGGSNSLWFKNTSYDDPTEFKTAMQGILVYYEKATPLDEQITPRIVPIQGGDNILYKVDGTLSHDASVKYLGYNV